MALFSELRSLVLLRRIAIALERIAEAEETQARLASDADDRRVHEGYRPRPKPVEIGMFDQTAASRQWRRQVIESGAMTEEELNDEYGALPEK